MSTKSTSTPYFSFTKLLKCLLVPPYTSSELNKWSPGLKVYAMQVTAAMPLENAIQYLPFSRLAKQFSKAVLVGLPKREYK